MWFLVPILIPIIITILSPGSPVFGFVQYVIFASPAYYLIVSKGIIESKKYRAILVLVVILSVLPLHSYYANFNKQQWRETAEYLQANREANEIVVVNPTGQVLSLGYYYKEDNMVGVNNIDDFVSKIGEKDSFWFVYSSEKYWDPKGELKNYLDSNFKLSKKEEFTGVKVFHYIS